MNIFVFTGAGASVEVGVPAMARMADGFRRHVNQWDVQPELVSEWMPEGKDIEDLIDTLDSISSTGASLTSLGVSEESLRKVRSVQAEVEWYVQHTCEQVRADAAYFFWSSLLESSSGHSLVIATTNYDRAVELAANRLDCTVRDGFGDFGDDEIAPWSDFKSDFGFTDHGVTLLKLHGSTDWYELGGSGNPVKLRHPMPLFGQGALRLPNVDKELTASLILPSREKRVARPPYSRLSQVFLNAAGRADLAIFVGSSFRDPHILQAAKRLSDSTSTFIVDPQSQSISGLEAASSIPQNASEFFISTLPAALASAEPIDVLKASSQTNHETVDALHLLETASDPSMPTGLRCERIETLADHQLALSAHVLRPLLEDPDELVSRFALGLIPDSPNSESLFELAESVSSLRADDRFADEVSLLRRLLQD